MKIIATFLLLLLTTAQSIAKDPATSELDSLGRQFAALRAMPIGDPSPISCPADSALSNYIGLNQQELYRRLGQPDYVSKRTARHWYKLTRPVSENLRGGGYCSIGFMFSGSGVVSDVSVSIAI